jgi:hypothetical protein
MAKLKSKIPKKKKN